MIGRPRGGQGDRKKHTHTHTRTKTTDARTHKNHRTHEMKQKNNNAQYTDNQIRTWAPRKRQLNMTETRKKGHGHKQNKKPKPWTQKQQNLNKTMYTHLTSMDMQRFPPSGATATAAPEAVFLLPLGLPLAIAATIAYVLQI